MPEINLTHVDSQYTQRLFQFFDAQAKAGIKVWKKRTPYFFNDGTEFSLHHVMFQRDRKEGHAGVRYELISNDLPIGAGSFAKIRKIEATIALDENTLRCKKRGENKTRVVKIQDHSAEQDSLSNLDSEYNHSLRASHLAIKKPTVITVPAVDQFTKSYLKSYMVMKHIPGCEIFDIINDDINRTKVLSTQQRFLLSNALLRALRDQVTGLGIVHRDIKIENIMVSMGPPILINIIDYGLSMDAAHPDGKQAGTPAYAASEIFNAPSSVNEKADVFSMARVIALLWRVDFWASYDKDGQGRPLFPVDQTMEQMLVNIFDQINDLDVQSQKSIKDVLVAMLQHDPAKRLTLDEAIERFPSGPTLVPKPPAAPTPAAAEAASSMQLGKTPTGALDGISTGPTLMPKRPNPQDFTAVTTKASGHTFFVSEYTRSNSQSGALPLEATPAVGIQGSPFLPALMPKSPAVQHVAAAASAARDGLFASKSGSAVSLDSTTREKQRSPEKAAKGLLIEESELFQILGIR